MAIQGRCPQGLRVQLLSVDERSDIEEATVSGRKQPTKMPADLVRPDPPPPPPTKHMKEHIRQIPPKQLNQCPGTTVHASQTIVINKYMHAGIVSHICCLEKDHEI